MHADVAASGLPPLPESLPISLARARDGVLRLFVPVLRPLDLTEQQWRVLRALVGSPSSMSVGELATSTALLGPSIARMLPVLDERGLISRTIDPADARRVECSATDLGRKTVASVADELRRQYERIEETLGADGLATLTELLGRLAMLEP